MTQPNFINNAGQRMDALMDTIKNDISYMQSSPYETLTAQLYDLLANYTNNGTNIVFANIPYISVYQLLVEEIKVISCYKNLSSFAYNSSSIATLIYNTQNIVYKFSMTSTDLFMLNMMSLYNDQLQQSKLMFIILMCIFALLVSVQAPTSYALDSIAMSQVDIFLKLPLKVCAVLAADANSFVGKIQVSYLL